MNHLFWKTFCPLNPIFVSFWVHLENRGDKRVQKETTGDKGTISMMDCTYKKETKGDNRVQGGTMRDIRVQVKSDIFH